MTETTAAAEQIIVDRFRQKCQAAGGPRAGFVLRRAAILYVRDEYPELDLAAGIDSLVDSGVLKASDSGNFLFLSATGVQHLAGRSAPVEQSQTPKTEPS
jgi:hypothetical protein